MAIQIKELINLSLNKTNSPFKPLTDNLHKPITCDENETLYIAIDKVILPRHVVNYYKEKSYIPIRVAQAYTKIKEKKDRPDKLDKFGPIVYEYSGFYEWGIDIHYYPIIGKEIKQIDFYLDLQNVKNIYEDVEIDLNQAIKGEVTIQYNIIKIQTSPGMERLIHKSIILSSNSCKETYPENTTNNFRCHLETPLDTSHSTGQPYVQLNSITIPASLSFTEILKDAYITLVIRGLRQKKETAITFATRFLNHYPENSNARSRNAIYYYHNAEEEKCAEETLEVPLFFPDDKINEDEDDFDLLKQISKRLKPIKLEIYSDDPKLQFINKNDRIDNVIIRFSPPSLAAAVGHELRKTIKIDKSIWERGDVFPLGPSTYQRKNSPKAKNEVYEREIELTNKKKTRRCTLPFDLSRLSPSSIFIYADFIDETFVNDSRRRLLAIIDTSKTYKSRKTTYTGHELMLIDNKRPIVAHICFDKTQFMHFTLETSHGKPYPFIKNTGVDLCQLGLSFRYQ